MPDHVSAVDLSPSPLLIDVAGVRVRLGVCEATAYRVLDRIGFSIGRKRVCRPIDLEEFVEQLARSEVQL